MSMTSHDPSSEAQRFLLQAIRSGTRDQEKLREQFIAGHDGPRPSLEIRFNSAFLALIRRRRIYRHPTGWHIRKESDS